MKTAQVTATTVEVASGEDRATAAAMVRERAMWVAAVHAVGIVDGVRPGPGELHDPAAFYAPPEGRLLLAKWDGYPAGAAGLRVAEPGRIVELRRCFVDLAHRRRGVGTALAAAALEHAADLGADTLRVDVALPYVDAAQRIVGDLGFVIGDTVRMEPLARQLRIEVSVS